MKHCWPNCRKLSPVSHLYTWCVCVCVSVCVSLSVIVSVSVSVIVSVCVSMCTVYIYFMQLLRELLPMRRQN